MSAHKTVCFLTLLLSAPFLALGQKVIDSKLATKVVDLSNKIFLIGTEGDTSKAGNDLHLLFLFYKDGNATFRTKRGSTIIKDSPISWRFTGDSLYLQPGSISLQAEGKTQIIDREPMKYFIVKAPSGYLLKGKDDQMLLIEQK
ncbi:hypothetical protein [Spirosoma fluminis]